VPEAIAGAEFSLQNLASNISLEGLAQLSSDGRALPKLAESWTWEEDGLVLRTRIRKGIIFHDGTPLTAPLAADILKKAIAKPENRVLYTSFADVMNVEAKRYSFQPSKNAITATVMRAGTDRGSVMRHSVPIGPHPSMSAASRTSRGMVSM